ncbi:MAG TPA: ABC transporter permease [Euzebyales bacterium]|nr:ABC transporter permease [Euzebyales bacterium]
MSSDTRPTGGIEEPRVPPAAGIPAETRIETAAPVPAAGSAPTTPSGPKRRVHETAYFALRNPKFVIGAIVIVLFLAAAVIGPRFTDYQPYEYAGPSNEPPGSEFWLGTTTFGQDVYTQFVLGLGSTFVVGLLGGGLATLIGMVVGFTAGYRGGRIDEVLSMATNVVLTIPVLAALIIVAAYLEVRGVVVEAVLIGIFNWPWIARAIRAQTFTLRTREFVDLARLSGVGTSRIIRREIAPNMSSYLVLVLILSFGGAILNGAFLEFLGLGPTDAVTLGTMINNAVLWSALNLGLWWWFIPPGLAITLIVGALYFMNVGLDEVFNPKLRET